jgi:hypothetical protein
MTIAGWIFMIVSLGSVLTLLIFCFIKVLKSPAADDNAGCTCCERTPYKGAGCTMKKI